MRKWRKLKNLKGAIVGFNADTPMSGEGEQEQYVILKVTDVFKAKGNQKYYVKGINLKRLQNSVSQEFRQYQIDRIVNGTIVIFAENEWSLTHSQAQFFHRYGDKGVVKYEPKPKVPPMQGIEKGLAQLRDMMKKRRKALK